MKYLVFFCFGLMHIHFFRLLINSLLLLFCNIIQCSPHILSSQFLQFWYIKLTKISFGREVYTLVWDVILSILRSQMNLCTLEIILGSQNWSDYIFQTISTSLQNEIFVRSMWQPCQNWLVLMWVNIGGISCLWL